jgi:tricorn protease
MNPKLVREGHDPQLEKAVEVVMEQLKSHPVNYGKRPTYPDYQKGKGATPRR